MLGDYNKDRYGHDKGIRNKESGILKTCHQLDPEMSVARVVVVDSENVSEPRDGDS